ncbi:phytanoyl-CoA dioxygenase family protein [Paenibacillus sp. MWE-103]|uniref:Phytanoyl-CoA dioxygenase family protein n=1 Tax=Paenibacillus artemisiicola TaxID=1172618 RepID=A0ABS3W832_9BACL|nr:phytanoyl-CoA dioxygenase family protein [Paenibacillus artemisiicola]MBO7744433.1 phytanoyl-CoA dioxygenase family protein [Paenibacillus artemisiicola]
MELTYRQKRHLIDQGYVKVPGVVPKIMIRETMKAINHSIGKGIPEGHHGANYCRELERKPLVTDLFNRTPVKTIIDSLVGEDAYHPIGMGQLALRFPDYIDNPPDDLGAHLDGVLHVKDSIAQNFTALVGVILSDQSEPDHGNFTVYPGTHKAYELYFREHGAEVLFRDEGFRTMHRSASVPLSKPVQITGEPGDLIITHYQLVHAGGINLSERIRYSTYFRVDHKDRHTDWQAPLLDMWRHWPGLRSTLA